jgi:spore germination cell wall hydrolase CwlJ-like protein
MFTSLLDEVRIWPVLWRRRLAYSWPHRDRGNLAFLAVIGLMILAVAAIIYFAYQEEPRTEPIPAEVVQRQTNRAQRRANELRCLAENIYFEARGEPLAGQYAVAEVTLNRTQAQHFPHTVCEVVHETRWDPGRRRYVADFSWTESGTLSPEDGPAWKQAMTIATAVYDDTNEPLVPGALFYHATSVRPGWASTRTAVARIGNHIFYR